MAGFLCIPEWDYDPNDETRWDNATVIVRSYWNTHDKDDVEAAVKEFLSEMDDFHPEAGEEVIVYVKAEDTRVFEVNVTIEYKMDFWSNSKEINEEMENG